MWPLILLSVVALIAILLLVVAMRPAEFRVVRRATIAGPASEIFARVNDFHRWTEWSPWEGIDPNLKRTYAGPESGAGANYHWAGNNKVGEGQMTIVQSRPGELVKIKLDFLRPMKCTNTAEFTFVPQGDGTLVTWSMTGTKNMCAKAFGMVCNMDKMVGGDFEKGLARLKTEVEGQAAAPVR